MKICLSEIAEFITDGTHGSPERVDIGIPVLSAQNVAGGVLSYSTGRYTTEAEYQLFKKRLDIAIGDVLLTIVGSIGRAAVVRESKPAVFQRSVAVIRPKPQVADPSYLVHLFHSSYFQSELYRNSNQSSQAGVYLGRLGSIEIPLPPLEEQRRIAAILDKADSLEKLSQSAVARLHQTLASSFRHLSSVATPDCTSRKLEEVVEAIIDYRGKSPEKTAKGVPLITARLIKEGRILEATEFIAPESYSEWMRRGMPKRGDVVFTTEAPLGQVAQIDNPDVALAQRLVLLRGKPRELDNTYLRFALRMSSVAEQIRKRATGSTVLGIRQKELRQIQIPLPPLTAQKDFARLALAIEEKIRQMRQRGDITKALRHSLASRLMEE